MPIIRFSFDRTNVPADAVNLRAQHYGAGYERFLRCELEHETGNYTFQGPHVVWLWDEYTGVCLFTSEMNGYDDSDFYMTIWDAEQQAQLLQNAPALASAAKTAVEMGAPKK